MPLDDDTVLEGDGDGCDDDVVTTGWMRAFEVDRVHDTWTPPSDEGEVEAPDGGVVTQHERTTVTDNVMAALTDRWARVDDAVSNRAVALRIATRRVLIHPPVVDRPRIVSSPLATGLETEGQATPRGHGPPAHAPGSTANAAPERRVVSVFAETNL